ncbi:hypothetical protein H8356DRAFT_963646 [Neocallimastix lanati (nom. inval.)]|uniref:Uncharacterized protein n=1 Tax=Neocallimastix californiae TaxID=1754190 RepID=A0A1Y2BWS5_9FUNG|nr:hypothetical protein H8356DRAFT_963646 [Neocallimastix sp. JGI-2020a]ORY39222.1 hypothetical protein LY90DRAFT_46198 [Neocallimastix californiae]|eukprot:ORY39222.1 hypothetical protein LY90DRAFT_46198 [Neocallimastix californiae]
MIPLLIFQSIHFLSFSAPYEPFKSVSTTFTILAFLINWIMTSHFSLSVKSHLPSSTYFYF